MVRRISVAVVGIGVVATKWLAAVSRAGALIVRAALFSHLAKNTSRPLAGRHAGRRTGAGDGYLQGG